MFTPITISYSISGEFFGRNTRIGQVMEDISPDSCYSGTFCLHTLPISPQQRLLGHHQIAQRTGSE